MKEEDKFLIFLAILWKIFGFIWLCFAYGTIMLIGHIVYNILFNAIEYSNTVMILCGIGFVFCMGMLQGYYKSINENKNINKD